VPWTSIAHGQGKGPWTSIAYGQAHPLDLHWRGARGGPHGVQVRGLVRLGGVFESSSRRGICIPPLGQRAILLPRELAAEPGTTRAQCPIDVPPTSLPTVHASVRTKRAAALVSPLPLASAAAPWHCVGCGHLRCSLGCVRRGLAALAGLASPACVTAPCLCPQRYLEGDSHRSAVISTATVASSAMTFSFGSHRFHEELY